MTYQKNLFEGFYSYSFFFILICTIKQDLFYINYDSYKIRSIYVQWCIWLTNIKYIEKGKNPYLVLISQNHIYLFDIHERYKSATCWRRRKVSLALFKNWKKCSDLGKKCVLIVFIPGLHFSFNIKFSEHLVEKTTKFLSFGSFSYVAVETFT